MLANLQSSSSTPDYRYKYLGKRPSNHFRSFPWSSRMAEGIPCTHEDIIKLLEDTRVELEEMLNELEMLSVQATCMTYDIVILRTDPSVVESMMRLNEAYLNCKESVAKDYMEMLTEPKKNESETV
ncbi:synaptonemal complex central element protein 3 [Hemiscyllium ocellatum]|uniref:synaptonemal complex central element protein 3 n=1 Tax=Hemiscyllium ocellatum TaxID=170820 RepID=UPI0029667DE8|nr:synaptonemal complex central element protein 3 [Hemiscyllium ocellatum]